MMRGTFAGLLICISAMFVQAADVAALPDSSVKAAFLYKFLSYIEWPGRYDADQPFKFGVIGSPAVADELRALTANRNIDGRSVTVTNVQRAHDLEGVQMLFVGRQATSKLAMFADQAQQQGIVTVTETSSVFPDSVINFVIVDGRVRFEVSIPAAKRAGVKLSSRLLAVAKYVDAGVEVGGQKP